MVDRRNVLSDERPFSCSTTSDGKVRVSFHGTQVAVLVGKEAAKAMSVIATGDEIALQLFLAKATGNFKRGNERRGGK